MKKQVNKYKGSSFDEFLKEEKIYYETKLIAFKRVISFQIQNLMEEQNINKSEMARRMSTSRASLERLLDQKDSNVTIATLNKAAIALGRELKLELV